MTVSWTPHRFAGGVLALDVANTVVLRDDPARSLDRFADIREIVRFAEVASTHREAELGARRLAVGDTGSIAPKVLAIREATDRLFRNAVLGGWIGTHDLAPFLSACARGLDGHDE